MKFCFWCKIVRISIISATVFPLIIGVMYLVSDGVYCGFSIDSRLSIDLYHTKYIYCKFQNFMTVPGRAPISS